MVQEENVQGVLMDRDEQMVEEMVHFVGQYVVEPKMDHDEELRRAHLVADQYAELKMVHVEAGCDVELGLDLVGVLHVQR